MQGDAGEETIVVDFLCLISTRGAITLECDDLCESHINLELCKHMFE